MKPTSRFAVTAAGIGCMATGLAFAGALDFTPYAEFGVTGDDNVLRVDNHGSGPDSADRRGDAIQYAALGVLADWPMSRQRLVVRARTGRYHYDNFDRFDHGASELSSALEYEVGPMISGTADYRYDRSLADFANRNDSRADSIRLQQPQIETNLDVTPDWRVHTRFGYLRLDHSLESQQRFDRREKQALVALQYRGVADSQVGLGGEYISGRFPQRGADDRLADAFDQTTVFTRLNWNYSEVSALDLRLGYTRRDNAGGASRDFDGVTGRMGYARELTDRTRLSASLSRDIYSVDNVDANYLRETAIRLNLGWSYSPKLNFVARVARREQDYANLPGAVRTPRHDTLDTVMAELVYQPYRNLALVFDARPEHRNSNRPGEDYDALVGGVAVRVSLDGGASDAAGLNQALAFRTLE